MSPRTRLLAILLVAIPLAAGCRERPVAAPPAALDRLLGLMQQRLAVAHDVARWKWSQGKPISDPDREARLLEQVVGLGRDRGLGPQFVRSFFAAQMEAGKLIQQADFDRWRTDKRDPEEAGPDLATLRARIDQLDVELLDALAEVGPLPFPEDRRAPLKQRAAALLDGAGIDEAVRARALRPLW
jgi:chorismate mutase